MTAATAIPARSIRPLLARLAALLALGALSSLGLAWSISILNFRIAGREWFWIEHRSVVFARDADSATPERSGLASAAWTSSMFERFSLLSPVVAQAAWTRIVESRAQAGGLDLTGVGCLSVAAPESSAPLRFEGQILTCDAGWPFRSWSAELVLAGDPTGSAKFTVRSATDAAALGSSTQTGPATALWPTPLHAPLPIRPRWPALPFEILVHASAWTVLLASALWLRAALRLRGRRCPHCGYHLAGLPSCPECGRNPDTP